MARGHVTAEGQVAAEGHDAAKGHVAAEGHVAAKGHDVAEGHDAAEGHDVAEGQVAIFSKDKGYCCPIANNNQLGGWAIGVDFTIVFDETIVIVEIVSANKAIAIDRAIAVDRANMVNEADEASLAKVNELLAYGGIAVVIKYSSKLLTLLPFSLTKYFAGSRKCKLPRCTMVRKILMR